MFAFAQERKHGKQISCSKTHFINLFILFHLKYHNLFKIMIHRTVNVIVINDIYLKFIFFTVTCKYNFIQMCTFLLMPRYFIFLWNINHEEVQFLLAFFYDTFRRRNVTDIFIATKHTLRFFIIYV